MATIKQTVTHNGSTSSSVWTWKQVVTEKWNDDYITTNKSIIQVDTYLGRTSSSGSYFGGTASLSITCNGSTKSTSRTFPYPTNVSAGGWVLAQSETFEVEHNSDGTKSISISSSLSTSQFNPNSASASGNLQLSTIPRTSKVTCPSFNIGDSTVVNIERFSSSFRDTITWSFGSLSGTLATKTSNTSVGFSPSANNFHAQIPNARSGIGTITCKTYNGNTLIGTSTCSFTAYVVEDDPDIQVAIVDTNNTTIALTGSSSKIVRYMSKPKFTINATAKKSATISSYALSVGDGNTYTSRETTVSGGVPSNTYVATATDSRGYSNSLNGTISNFVNYVKASFTKKLIYRTESASTQIMVDLEGNYFNGSFGSQNNSITLKYRTRVENGSWSSYRTVTATVTGNTFKYTASLGNSFSINNAYEVEFVVSDKLTTDTLSVLITKGLSVIEVGDELVNVNGDLTVNDYIVPYFTQEETW